MRDNSLVESLVLEMEGRSIICSIRKNLRARRISVRIVSKAEVVLTVPSRGSVRKAKDFLQSKIAWISRKTLEYPNKIKLGKYLSENRTVWLDERRRWLSWTFSNNRKRTFYQVECDQIKISFPEVADEECILLKFLMQLARIYLPIRLEACAKKVGVHFQGARIGNQKSRWGSCSSQRVISLNWRILLLDYRIGEYVLYHELAHLKHMNHSKRYWELLETWIANSKSLDKELSVQGKGLMFMGR